MGLVLPQTGPYQPFAPESRWAPSAKACVEALKL